MAKLFKMTLYVCDLEENLSLGEIETLIRQDALDGPSLSALVKFADQAEGPSIEFGDDTDLNRSDCPASAWEKYFTPAPARKVPVPGQSGENTAIEFLYRDGSNFKTMNRVVLPGAMTQDQIDRIMACRDDGEYFIPERLGLDAERWVTYDDQWDHIWCELHEGDIHPTNLPWTDDVAPEELVRRFEAMRGRWEEKPLPFDFCVPVPEIEEQD